MFDRRSSLGLVGGSINVDSSAWVSREATTGPGVDSYYEYLLKSYLMFGNLEHLQMFTELYGSVMQQLQPPSYLPGSAFLVSAHMDSGRLSRTFVSSLAAFWPAMQALVGLEEEAVQLHEGFLSAWREFGWLPELFGLELEQIDPHDPGYQLRPESIESNYILYALTQDPKYLDVARRIQRILNTHNRVKCGFASINNVTTGMLNDFWCRGKASLNVCQVMLRQRTATGQAPLQVCPGVPYAHHYSDIQESYFLSETVKYLYLTFVEGSGALLDYFIFSTEGHLLPPQPPADQEAATAEERVYLEAVAESRHESKCTRFCETSNPVKQAATVSQLQQAFPLLHFDAADAELIQRRRCVACTQVTKHMGSKPAADSSLKIEQLSSAIQTAYVRFKLRFNLQLST
ncbi:glycoside hydrolase [Dunaliella salina]|nr:glycoside hydrolase [Dunaliella salina]|eukprot:KAF5837668.1 glycoside hydrolase [Dunaliella salina]